jgi:hypothetical protein
MHRYLVERLVQERSKDLLAEAARQRLAKPAKPAVRRRPRGWQWRPWVTVPAQALRRATTPETGLAD